MAKLVDSGWGGRARKGAMTSALLVGVLAAALLLVSPGQAATAGVSCHKINATGVGQDYGDGSTTAQITDGGLLQGTTAGSFSVLGGAPRSSPSVARSRSRPTRELSPRPSRGPSTSRQEVLRPLAR